MTSGRQKLMAGWVKSHTGDLLRYARSRVKDRQRGR
jgi:hypothetical protein